MATNDVRAKMHAYMVSTLADELKNHTWIYREIRPMYVPPHWAPGQHVQGDCSKGCQYLCCWAGGPDPMKQNYGPYGNSSTLCAVLQHLDKASELEIGDYVTFGVAGSEHAACVMERGTDPLLWSFGHQGAPNIYHLSADKRPHQLLRNPVPQFIPTPLNKLQKKTGYFAWISWKLGEGDWHGHGKANKHVRPSVPKIIPLAWWKRYTLFLANRKRGNKPTG